MPKDKLHSLSGIEIFSVGTWNGDKYSGKDLDDMVFAFNKTNSRVRPSLKLGHDSDQSILQKDGLPAAGWVSNVYRQGQKLLADFVEIPDKIYQLIKNKAYRKVSSEIYWNLDFGNGEKYNKLLSAVALLGSDMPAVTSLDDMLALYGLKFDGATTYTQDNIKTYHFNKQEDNMSEEIKEEIKEEKAAEAVAEEVKEEPKEDEKVEESKDEKAEEKKPADEKAEDVVEEKSKDVEDLEELKKENSILAEEVTKYKMEKEDAERESFLLELEKENLVSPAMRPYVIELLGENKKEYSINDKSLNKNEIVKEVFSLAKALTEVNLDESSEDGDKAAENSIDKIEDEMQKYAMDNKCTYGDAYKAIHKKHNIN